MRDVVTLRGGMGDVATKLRYVAKEGGGTEIGDQRSEDTPVKCAPPG